MCRSLPNTHIRAVLGFILLKFPRASVALCCSSYVWLERATVRAGDWTWAKILPEFGKDHKELKEQLTACKACWRELLNDVHDSSVVQQGVTKQKAGQHTEMLVQSQIPWEVVLFKLCQKKSPQSGGAVHLHKSRTTLQSRNVQPGPQLENTIVLMCWPYTIPAKCCCQPQSQGSPKVFSVFRVKTYDWVI